MKKYIIATLAATILTGGSVICANNPFSDVSPSDWAYKAVSRLASEGVINGYPSKTFNGQKAITRYEMAQMVAKAMVHQKNDNLEQQELIDGLANEFSSELKNLGVRVSNVETKLGNVTISGDARIQYLRNSGMNVGKDDSFYSRMRLNVRGAVSDRTTVGARIKMEYTAGEGGSTVKFDQLWINQSIGKTQVVTGRMPVALGSSFIYDGPTVDGITVKAKKNNIEAYVGYGYADLLNSSNRRVEGNLFENNSTMVFGQLATDIMKNLTMKAYYVKMTSSNQNSNLRHSVAGASLDAHISKLWIGGEYGKVVASKDGYDKGDARNYAWTTGVGYGDFDLSKKGTYDVKLQYINAPKTHSPVIASTMDFIRFENIKGYMATVDYTLTDNLCLTGVYNFDAKDQDNQKIKNMYFVQLNYQF